MEHKKVRQLNFPMLVNVVQGEREKERERDRAIFMIFGDRAKQENE